MEIECTVRRHVPHHFGQHAECHHDKHIGIAGAQGSEELLVAQLLGLQQWQGMVEGILFNGAEHHFLSPTRLPVGHGNHSHHLVTALCYGVEAFDREIGSAKEYYTHRLLR